MSEKLFFRNSKGLKICGILEEPNPDKKEIVIIVHGYASNKNGNSSKQIAKELIIRNINSFRIDLGGCGESEGKFEEQTITSAVDDVSSAIRFVKKRGYSKVDLFGSSAGGLTVMATVLKHSEFSINRIALKAPVSDYPHQRLRKYGQNYIDKWRERGYVDYEPGDGRKLRVNYNFYEDTKKYVMYGKIKNIECPVLIIHGTADKIVDVEDSKRIIRGFPNGKLIILEGADHGLSIEGDSTKSNKLFGDWFEKGELL